MIVNSNKNEETPEPDIQECNSEQAPVPAPAIERRTQREPLEN